MMFSSAIPDFVVKAMLALDNPLDAGIPLNPLNDATAPQAVPAPENLGDLEGIAKNLWEAVINRQWGLVASLAVVLIIVAARKYIPDETPVGVWIRSKIGAIVLNFALAFGGAFATMLAAGQAFSAVMVFKALTIALSAAGGWAIWKNINEAIQEKKAVAAGEAVAADPKKTEDTLNQ